MRELIARVRGWLRRDQLDAEVVEELRVHRSLLEREREEARDRWGLPWLDGRLQDARYALRGLRRAPGFTVAVVLTLGLGIGANAAMFGIVDRLLLRPAPFLREPARVDRVYLATAGWNRDQPYALMPYARYRDLARWSGTLDATAAFAPAMHGVGAGESGRAGAVLAVTASFFGFFELRPALGRVFGEAEDAAGANVVVLDHEYWRTELGARRDVLGEPLQVGSAAYTIVGVAPAGFAGVDEGPKPAVYVPISAYAAAEGGPGMDWRGAYDWDLVQVMARRRPGVGRAAATADLTLAFRRSWEASRLVHPRYAAVEVARPSAIAAPLRLAAGPAAGLEARTLLWVSGVAALVFLIACANVANLLLARALARRREVALRVALGVSRRRLAGQVLTESLLFATLGCAAGLVVAEWGGGLLRRLLLPDAPSVDVATDWRTLLVAAGAALVAAAATGIAPLLLARRHDPAAVLREGGRSVAARRTPGRAALLVVQGALSFALLVGAALFVRSLDHVRRLPLGYDIDRLLLVQWEPRGAALDSAAEVALRERLLAAAVARPEVERGAWTTGVPFAPGTTVLNLAVPGVDSVRRLGRFAYQATSTDYFATAGTRIVRGRGFTERDRAGAPPVTVVSRAMADRIWPGADPVGRCLQVSWRSPRPDTMPCTTVVGVADDALHDPVADLPMRYYLPESQIGFAGPLLLLRVRGELAAAAEPVRRTLQAAMPGAALVSARPARDLLDAKRRSWTLGATMFVAFGLLALVVAAVGLYGVIAYDVAQRTHELGVRVALGARAGDVVRLVLAHGVRLAAGGLLGGATLALAAARWLEPLLFRQSATDPSVFALVAALTIGVAIAACLLPARRAVRADPNTVLRAD